jgi:NAD(P)-dependent dehydrogenase (short-subunit alcohol dehydrogenase family)
VGLAGRAARQDRQHRLDAQLPGRRAGAELYRVEERPRRLTKLLANEWAAKGINVNAIAPGYIATANTAALQADETRNRQILERIPEGRWGDPADIGGAAVFLASSAADYVQGHVLAVDGGWLAR